MRFIPRVLVVAMALLCPTTAWAEVTRFDVTSRTPIQGYGYERVAGRMTFSVDPRDPRNAVIVDLDKAPRTAAGRVEFSADVVVLMPTAGGNGVTLIDVVNRGAMVTPRLARAGNGNDREFGDGFLLKQGFTVVALGWEFDTPRNNRQLTLDAPIATDNGRPISGIVRSTFVPDRADASITLSSRDSAFYPPDDPTGTDSVLTVRNSYEGTPAVIPRDKWQLTKESVSLTGGFTPGLVYELAYRAINPRVGGVGLLAVRDTASWFKHASEAPIRTPRVYAMGVSQTGRVLRDFLYHGCNTDERGRQVFDAMLIHIAGASRIDLNQRWALPTSVGSYSATSFPFADAAQRDPATGVTEGQLDNVRARTNQPRIFYTNTGVEYWGGARAAALLHTSVDGTRDVAPAANVRMYFLAGSQHGPGAFPPAAPTNVQQRQNPTDYWWAMRALLVAMDRWVREGTEPPASAVPTIADGTLVRASDLPFPAIRGVQSPRTVWGGARSSNPLIQQQGAPGTALPLLVPQVDADGNERAGIRLPDVAVPLATYTGWNFRNQSSGGTEMLRPLIGSYVPFAATREQRQQASDPRQSVAERYASRDAYIARIREVAVDLVRRRYLLQEDVAAIEARALEHWQLVTAASTEAAKPAPAAAGR